MSTEPDDAPPSDDDAPRQDDATSDDAPPSNDDAMRLVETTWEDDPSDDDLATLEHFPQVVGHADLMRFRQAVPFPEHPTLCIRLREGGKLETDHDSRLQQLDWRDRTKILDLALSALAITPHEYLEHGGFFIEARADSDDDPRMLAQWLKVSRIVVAAYYEAGNVNSEFLTKADAAARAALEQHNETYLFSARSVAFGRLRDELAILLESGDETETIARSIWFSMFEAKYHEIAQHIPDLNRATISKRMMLDKLNVARARPHKPGDFNEQAEYMIRAWLRAMGCPDKIVNGAFDPERHRDERKLGLR